MSDENKKSGKSDALGIGIFFLVVGLLLVLGGGYGVIQILTGGSGGYMVWLYPVLIGGMLIGFRLLLGTLTILIEIMKE